MTFNGISMDFQNRKKIITQGIKYAGSKLKLIPYIQEITEGLPVQNVLDGFAGTTRVSQAFAQMGYNVTSNDISYWSECFGQCYLEHQNSNAYYQSLIDELNHLPPQNGWFTENYGGDENDIKRPFQKKNMQKLDTVRPYIDTLHLNKIDRSVLLTSLILALDSVDNTLGHFSSYLKKWSRRSYQDMILRLPLLYPNNGQHHVTRKDIFELLNEEKEYDLAYFDPPYGSNNEKMPSSRVRYGSYYHFWTTVIKNDKPKLFGKALRREDTHDKESASVFEAFKKTSDGSYIAMNAIEKLLQKVKAKYILLSYSSGGRATKQDLKGIIDNVGKLKKFYEIDYKKNIMSDLKWTNVWINDDFPYKEYLFLIEKL